MNCKYCCPSRRFLIGILLLSLLTLPSCTREKQKNNANAIQGKKTNKQELTTPYGQHIGDSALAISRFGHVWIFGKRFTQNDIKGFFSSGAADEEVGEDYLANTPHFKQFVKTHQGIALPGKTWVKIVDIHEVQDPSNPSKPYEREMKVRVTKGNFKDMQGWVMFIDGPEKLPWPLKKKASDVVTLVTVAPPSWLKKDNLFILRNARASHVAIKQVLKYEDKYAGYPVHWRGEVGPISESEGQTSLDVENNGQDFFVEYLGSTPGIYKGDYVEVYGVNLGVFPYTSIAGWKLEAPLVYAVKVEKQ